MTKARLSESDLLSEESNEHLVVQHPVIIFIHSQPASQPPDRSVTARAGPSLRATPGASQARHAVSAPAMECSSLQCPVCPLGPVCHV